LSFDNLAGSFALVDAGAPLACAAVIGAVSGLAAACGFRTGELARAAVERLSGAIGIRWNGRYFAALVLFSAAVLLAIY
jgi:hypothetical protein